VEEKGAAELRRIQAVVEELTGLPCNWTGVVRLEEDPGFLGAKPFNCDIRFDIRLAGQDARWRTYIHELLHASSAGYSRLAFDEGKGWEEGPVETLQRLLRTEVLDLLSLDIPSQVFEEIETTYPYNPYVSAVENLSSALHLPLREFCTRLLATPILNRKATVLRAGLALPPHDRARFQSVYKAASRILVEDLDKTWKTGRRPGRT